MRIKQLILCFQETFAIIKPNTKIFIQEVFVSVTLKKFAVLEALFTRFKFTSIFVCSKTIFLVEILPKCNVIAKIICEIRHVRTTINSSDCIVFLEV